MTTLLVILIVWVVLSVPAAVLLARMFRPQSSDGNQRDDAELALRGAEFDRPADEFAPGMRSGGDDTYRVSPPR
ncbi:hypothetical protein AB0N05_04625 [Nocardia sp. NPDC051030]|uniref:hypothetical protein n=1 Tax=Nocardia sp. NPDC051030 TaxID=3155162 RepID=UPI00343C1D99